jgi:hypothetical protein
MLSDLKKFIENSGSSKNYVSILKRNRPDIVLWILAQTEVLSKSATMAERIYFVLHGNTRICPHGNEKTVFNTLNLGYKFCSKSCLCKKEHSSSIMKSIVSLQSIEKKKETSAKRKSTFLEKHGVENPSQLDFVKEKIKSGNLEKYGVEYVLQDKNLRKRIKQTNLEKYGVEYPTQSPEIRETIRQAVFDRYGVDHISQSQQTKNKVKQTNLEKYGVERPSQSEEIKEKTRQTNVSKYGVFYTAQAHIPLESMEILNNAEKFKTFAKDKSTKNIADALNVSEATVNIAFRKFEVNRQIIWHCENEVLEFLRSLNKGNWKKDRTVLYPKEIDFLNEELKIGIEYCGLYWHSEINGKDKTYHLKKTIEAASEGYRLIQIFEDEWILKKEIVKSRIINILGLSKKGIGARKTIVKEISHSEAKMFLDANHIQGSGTGDFLRYGAMHDKKIIAVMTFSKSRLALGSKSKNSIELLRFATDGRNHPGIASKLFKTFIKEHDPQRVISYADRRWSEGRLYKSLGFIETTPTLPNYWYFEMNSLKRTHRFSHRKDIIKHLVENGDKKTERQIQEERGYLRIWDCGNLKFEYQRESCN